MKRLRPRLAAALLLSVLALAGCAASGSGPARLGPTTARQTGTAANSPPTGEQRGMGSSDAPITVIEYSDFQCPFCARFASDTQAQLQQEYIDTGKVRFLYRDLPLTDIHPGALLAAHVANCAAEQGSFWPMHDQLVQGAAARAWGQGDMNDFNVFMGYAAALQLDVGKLQSCVQNNQFASQIQADMREATALGIRSTPTFVVNGQLLVGAQPIGVWRQALDGMLTQ